MALADALRPTDGGTVVLRAETSQFNSAIDQAERNWKDSVGSMSREAIKLDLANERLRASLAKTGATSASTKRATVQLRDAEEQAAKAADRLTKETNELNRAQQRTGRAQSVTAAGFGRAQSAALGFVGAFGGTTGVLSVVRQSIQASSDLSEQVNKARVVFGSSAASVEAWSRSTADSFGISQGAALAAAGTFGNLLRTVNLVPAKAALMSRSLVQLAADLASFNDADPSATLDALRSGLVGEAEPLRAFGVLLSESRVQQEAMRESGKRSAKQLTEQDKILARYNLILRDTVTAQGDFARTSNSAANATRRLHANATNLEATLGKTLLPTLTDVTGFLNIGAVAGNRFALSLRGVKVAGTDLSTILKEVALQVNPATGSIRRARQAFDFLFGDDTPKRPGAAVKSTSDVESMRSQNRAAGGATRRRRQPARGFTVGRLRQQQAVLEEAGLDAELTPGTGDDVRVLRQKLALVNRALKELKLTRDQRVGLKEERLRLLADLESIRDDEQRQADELRAKRAAARNAAAEKAERKHDREEERDRQARARRARSVDETQNQRWRLLKKDAERRRDEANKAKAAADKDKGLTEADMRRMQFDFLTGLQGALNQYGSNLWAAPSVGGGQTATNTHAMVHLLRDLNRNVDRLTRGVQHPGSKYARVELSNAFGGVFGV